MRACRNDFAKCKGNIPPEARGDVKLNGARLALTLAGDRWVVRGGGHDIAGVGRLGSGANPCDM